MGNSPAVTRQQPLRRGPSPNPLADSVQGSHREAFPSPVLPLAAFGVENTPSMLFVYLDVNIGSFVSYSTIFACLFDCLLYFFSYKKSGEKCVQ